MSKIHKDSPPSVHKQIFIFRPFSSSGASESANVTKKKHPSPNLIHSLGPKLIMEVENRLLVEENGHPRGQTIHVTMFPGHVSQTCTQSLLFSPQPPLFSEDPTDRMRCSIKLKTSRVGAVFAAETFRRAVLFAGASWNSGGPFGCKKWSASLLFLLSLHVLLHSLKTQCSANLGQTCSHQADQGEPPSVASTMSLHQLERKSSCLQRPASSLLTTSQSTQVDAALEASTAARRRRAC